MCGYRGEAKLLIVDAVNFGASVSVVNEWWSREHNILMLSITVASNIVLINNNVPAPSTGVLRNTSVNFSESGRHS